MAPSASDKIRLIEDHCRSFWEGDPEDFDRQLAPGFVDTVTPPEIPAGVEGAKEWARACRRLRPETGMTITDALVAGDVVAVRATWRGAYTDPLMTGFPTRDHAEVQSIVVWRLDEQGRIVQRTEFLDGAPAPEAPA